MDRNCPVKYIITVNALKEGWDCPNAYILASLADKSSAVEVEQILGRVLRQPYVTKHQEPLLNMSFVLTASVKFQETLDNIVKSLQEAGFSKDDYYAKQVEEEPMSREEVLQKELFEDKESYNDEPLSDEDFDLGKIDFNPNDNTTLEFYKNPETKTIISSITEKATIQGQEFEKNIENFEVDENTTLLQEVMNKTPQKSSIVSEFKSMASQISLPQFFIKVEDEVSDGILFDELKSDEELLHKGKLLDGFNLLTCDTQINFDEISAELYKVDFDESKGTSSMSKITQKAKSFLVDSILSKPQESQIRQVSSLIVSKLGDMTPI
jgi:type III restriction enzyme